ncbi:hypothetical protein HNQ59_001632 [Chitinivorax tropicus]|uniref:Uncharacterized protein n=1 Tax=Chitinivorax tropicus TaxID=714531 RepID=A0A840MGH5_9PROT|nr:hypothetical protein [Chitinivorax tropicus]MBB5018344.1 hypothetical protein [Chitinivorax tropicus]
MIVIELTAPQTVNGQRAAFQSLWMLVRIYFAHHVQQNKVRLDDLKGFLSDARTLRMAISRAFKDFHGWGVHIGWGEDPGRDPRFLNVDRRSQGPFWLSDGEAAKLVLLVAGQPATAADTAAFLGLPEQQAKLPPQQLNTTHDLAFWQQMILARQAIRLGRLVSPVQGAGEQTALSALKQAGQHAHTTGQAAQVLLAQAIVWRRLGDGVQARRLLKQLKQQRHHQQVDGNDFLDAMEQILAAWCAYDQRDLGLASSLLTQLQNHHQLVGLLRYHPTIRFEWHNLFALVLRSKALGQTTATEAIGWAQASLQHFEQALAAAFESASMDAAQQGAANLGMAMWLLHQCGLLSGEDPTPQAVQYIAFSEWLCRQSDQVHHSAWNPLYLMRIARGHCQGGESPTLAAFRQLTPITPNALRQWANPFADALPDQGGWHDIAACHLLEHDSNRHRYPVSQVCGLLFELVWFRGHAGQLAPASDALARLHGLLPELSRSDREYYRTMLRQLPTELQQAG